MALASMGIYVFRTEFLFEQLSVTPPIQLQP
jgi:ADP-glucose pyrophosphorylase